MDTLTKLSPPPSTARLRHALTELATLLDQTSDEVSSLETEFQQLLAQATAEAEAAVQKYHQERLVDAVAEAERMTRESVTEELKAQFTKELSRTEIARNELAAERDELQRAIQRLTDAARDQDEQKARLQEERDRAVQKLAEAKQSFQREMADTEEAAAIALERQMATTVERVRAEMASEGDGLQSRLDELQRASEKWDAERAHLVADQEQTRRLLAESEAEHSRSLSETRRAAAAAFERQMERVRSELTDEGDRLRQEVEQLARSAAQWTSERNRLNSELERANRMLADAKSGTREPEPRVQAAAAAANSSPSNPNLQAEMSRIEGQIKAITQIIDDPATELSVVFRKNSERAELESYLKGIRFLAGK